MFQIGRSGLHGIQQQRRRPVIDLLCRQQPHHLGQSHLDGIRVLERRQRYCPVLLDVQVNVHALPAPSHVKVTKFLLAQRWRSALRPVDFNMLTPSNPLRI